jgi:hypothetical protein
MTASTFLFGFMSYVINGDATGTVYIKTGPPDVAAFDYIRSYALTTIFGV